MSNITLSLGDLVAFKVSSKLDYIYIGIHGKGINSDKINYHGEIYYVNQVEVLEYGRNDGEHSNLYQAIANVYPKYVNLHPDDFVSYFLKKNLKPSELQKVEAEYNRIVKSQSTNSTDSFFGKKKKHW